VSSNLERNAIVTKGTQSKPATLLQSSRGHIPALAEVKSMHIPGLGQLSEGDCEGWLQSQPVPVRMFGGKLCRIVLEGYQDDENQTDFHKAIERLLAGGPDVLTDASESLYLYYKDYEEHWLEEGRAPLRASEVWQHVQFGDQLIVTRRPDGDKAVWVSIECECAWECEHGLELVLKHGASVTKLGPYDGHASNADSYSNPAFEHVVYVTIEMLYKAEHRFW
jgi:hypothetical protein